jgi:hypothetical protein
MLWRCLPTDFIFQCVQELVARVTKQIKGLEDAFYVGLYEIGVVIINLTSIELPFFMQVLHIWFHSRSIHTVCVEIGDGRSGFVQQFIWRCTERVLHALFHVICCAVWLAHPMTYVFYFSLCFIFVFCNKMAVCHLHPMMHMRRHFLFDLFMNIDVYPCTDMQFCYLLYYYQFGGVLDNEISLSRFK